MVSWKDYIKNQFLNKKVRFESDCCINMDVSGFIVDIEWCRGEALFHIQTDSGKIAKIGSNTENLKFKFL